MNEVTTVKCNKCGVEKDISNYRINKTPRGEYRVKVCRDCHNNSMKEHYHTHKVEIKERIKDKAKGWRDAYKNRHGLEALAEYQRNYYKNNPYRRMRAAIYNLVDKAIKDGTLTKPSTCSMCGTGDKRIESHHPDYKKPLEVIWVCTSCHGKLHTT